ncbi:hypothetical protein RHAB21_00693 [Pseudorhizobium halotolerans]|uniref:Uncharacterized protein n=1 Tax=Pseudorhizobium halotolerans TaxID=1233081 RepID=A0ABM8PYS9_9HYPH|nr:hypothetical protein [Pseudorhizobium halotolerans]CAD7055307.1 hypothetical protein RHAB21_00693 [Pseudorhizobium halotolerans]
MKSIEVTARVVIPIDDIVEAVGPEVSKTLISAGAARAKTRPPALSLRLSVQRVIAALDQLETVTNTVGETNARKVLMQRLLDLRVTFNKTGSI